MGAAYTKPSNVAQLSVPCSLAYAEIYLTIAAVVRRFDWELYETTLDDIVCQRDFFVAVASLESKGVRARLSLRRSHSR